LKLKCLYDHVTFFLILHRNKIIIVVRVNKNNNKFKGYTVIVSGVEGPVREADVLRQELKLRVNVFLHSSV
jgi:hypothetical protein